MSRAALLLLLVLCAPAWALEKVALQLKWKHQFQFAGYYAAVEKGYYRDAGLEVELREMQPDTDVVADVVAGRAAFGVGTSDLVLARAAGQPVLALAVILQHSPLVLLARQDRAGVVQSLAGKRIMVAPGEAELFAYLKQEGLGKGSFQLVPHNFQPADLIAGKVDAMSGYSSDEPPVLRQAHFTYSMFSPRSAGIDFYGDNLFTNERLLREKPGLVTAFREASLKGWRYAMQHPEEIADLILAKYSQRHSRAHLLFEAEEMARLMQPELVEIGHMNPGRWRHIAETYVGLDMLPANTVIDGLIYDPQPPKLPRWTLPALAAGFTGLLLFGIVAWRFAYFNRALNAEIEARNEAEKVARASAENFRHLMDIAPVPVVVTSLKDNRLLYGNQHALRAFASPEQRDVLLGRQVTDYYRNQAQRQRLVEELERHGFVTDLPVDLTNVRGEAVEALVSALIIDFEGEPAVYSVLIDVTERNRVDAALRASEAKAHDSNARLRLQLDEIAKLQTALKEQAIRDGLTGCFNRRYLDETLEREIRRARRDNEPLSVVMLDIDHFKQLNDTRGHQVGDEALRLVADILRQDIRGEDVPCRYGGEEFLILMPRMPLAVAAERAENWRRAIESMCLTSNGAEVRLTVSMGVAAYPEHGATPDELTQSADVALYMAKREGRNRIAVFSEV